MNVDVNRFRRLSQALVHFVIDRANLFTDQRISGLPIHAKYKHVRTIWEDTFNNSPTDFSSSSSVVVIDVWTRYFVELLSCPVCQLTISFHTFRGMTFHIVGHRRNKDFPSMVIFQLLLLKFWIQTWLCNCQQYLCLFHIVFQCIPSFHDQENVGSPKSTSLLSTFHIGSMFCFFPIKCHPHTQIRITLFHDEQGDIPNLEFSPSHVSIRFSQIAFPTTVLPQDDRTDSAQEEHLGLPFWTMIWAICVVVDESKMSGHYDFGIFNDCGASFILTRVSADTASAACPAQPDSLEMISMTFAAVICDADDPCSVNTA